MARLGITERFRVDFTQYVGQRLLIAAVSRAARSKLGVGCDGRHETQAGPPGKRRPRKLYERKAGISRIENLPFHRTAQAVIRPSGREIPSRKWLFLDVQNARVVDDGLPIGPSKRLYFPRSRTSAYSDRHPEALLGVR